MAWHVSVYVTLKPSVMDPQGATVQRALNQMGYKGVSGVRMGKFTELEFDGGIPEAEVKKQADEICDKLLANPNIESYRFTVEKKMRFSVTVFPGSNCDHDCEYVVRNVMGQPVEMIWHKDTDLKNPDCVVVPGGFSYGDYLRTGAIARFSPVMKSVADFAAKGGLVIGICNGFQILCEAGLLPGALIRNKSLKFICKSVTIKVDQTDTPFTNACRQDQVLKIPIAHGEGNYFIDSEGLKKLKTHRQIVVRYCDEKGNVTPESNPNGSLENIAGICNESRNVFGLMPHPDRSGEDLLGSHDGQALWKSILAAKAGVA